jgi:hypothetical protein
MSGVKSVPFHRSLPNGPADSLSAIILILLGRLVI